MDLYNEWLRYYNQSITVWCEMCIRDRNNEVKFSTQCHCKNCWIEQNLCKQDWSVVTWVLSDKDKDCLAIQIGYTTRVDGWRAKLVLSAAHCFH